MYLSEIYVQLSTNYLCPVVTGNGCRLFKMDRHVAIEDVWYPKRTSVWMPFLSEDPG